jgi:hypothetical protein
MGYIKCQRYVRYVLWCKRVFGNWFRAMEINHVGAKRDYGTGSGTGTGTGIGPGSGTNMVLAKNSQVGLNQVQS